MKITDYIVIILLVMIWLEVAMGGKMVRLYIRRNQKKVWWFMLVLYVVAYGLWLWLTA